MGDIVSLKDIPTLDRISAEAQREKSRLVGHVSALHPWWARLPLVVARAAVYAALTQESDQDLAFTDELCTYPGTPEAIHTAQGRILQAHIVRLSQEIGQSVTVEDIEGGRASRPQVLDLFSGSGTIPLEALRLGCEAFAVDLNPVAYLIQLCTLYYPQQFGEPTSKARGSAPDGTWAGLPAEVQIWSRWVHEQVEAEVGDLYPPILPSSTEEGTDGTLIPGAYLWARTVRCSNVACGAIIPLVRQAWLVRRRGRYVALRPELDEAARRVHYQVAESDTQQDLGFEPKPSVSRGEALCPFCNAHLARDYIRSEGQAGRLGTQLLAVVCRKRARQRVYLTGRIAEAALPDNVEIHQRIRELCKQTGLTTPEEPLSDNRTFGMTQYGLAHYQDLFTARQLLILLTYAKYIHFAHGQMHSQRVEAEQAKAITTYLGLLLDSLANANSTLSSWHPQVERTMPTYRRHALTIAWDFTELNPFADISPEMLHTDQVVAAIEHCVGTGLSANVSCASAIQLPFEDEFFDAIVTDPPYYDNVAYADLSDFFYVWLKRSIGHLYPSQFSSVLTPKEDEVIVVPQRHGHDQQAARLAYEQMMEAALAEAARVLKHNRLLTILIHSSEPDVLQAFLRLAKKAGLELFDVKRVQVERLLHAQNAERQDYQLLLTFKKSKFALAKSTRILERTRPIHEKSIYTIREAQLIYGESTYIPRVPQANADAKIVLRLAIEGKRTLYGGLIDLLRDHIPQEELSLCIPPEYKGALEVRLKEYIADCEHLGQLLDELLGRPAIIRIARDLSLVSSTVVNDPVSARNEILRSFGFNVPEPLQGGVTAAIARIEGLVPRVQMARGKIELRGALLAAMTLLEKTLYRAAWAWGYAIFGENRDEHLQEIVEGKPLDLLAMGDVKQIFCELPDYVARSALAEGARKLFVRPHLYKPKRLVKYLDKLVALRNKVEHNKGNYLEVTPLADMRAEFVEGINLARETLVRLKGSGAVPLIVKPSRGTTDMYGRCSVELQVEDGTTREVYVTYPLQLGRDYVFFRQESNPRPVDPPMFLLSDVLDTGD